MNKIEIKGRITIVGIIGAALFAGLGLYCAARGGVFTWVAIAPLLLAAACFMYARTEEEGKGIALAGWHYAVTAGLAIVALGGIWNMQKAKEHQEIVDTRAAVDASLAQSQKEYQEWQARIEAER